MRVKKVADQSDFGWFNCCLLKLTKQILILHNKRWVFLLKWTTGLCSSNADRSGDLFKYENVYFAAHRWYGV